MKKIVFIGGEMEQQVYLATHLAAFFSKENEVLIWDFQVGQRIVEQTLDLEEVVYDIYDYLSGICSHIQLIMESDTENILLAPSPFNKDKGLLTAENSQLLQEVDFPIQLSYWRKEEETEILTSMATHCIYLDDCFEENFQGKEFYFGKKSKENAVYLGKFPKKAQDSYWEKLGMALINEDNSGLSFSLWERLKEFFNG